MVKINGDLLALDGKTLEEYLISESYNLKLIAAELNGEIVPKHMYCKTVLKNGDTLEIVSFVGGG